MPVKTIQKLMRHKSHATTMGYLEKNLATAARAQDDTGASAKLSRTGE